MTGEHPEVAAPRDDARGSAGRVVLYRCRTPTDWLCPCGAVARRLRREGIEHETIRVPQRRAARLEVEELTGQRRVPVLVDGDEVIHDSRRILQYIAWRDREPDLYNRKRDGHPPDSDHADRQGGGEDQGVHGRQG